MNRIFSQHLYNKFRSFFNNGYFPEKLVIGFLANEFRLFPYKATADMAIIIYRLLSLIFPSGNSSCINSMSDFAVGIIMLKALPIEEDKRYHFLLYTGISFASESFSIQIIFYQMLSYFLKMDRSVHFG